MTYGSVVEKLKSADEVIDQFQLEQAKKKFAQVPDVWNTASPENVNQSGIRNPSPVAGKGFGVRPRPPVEEDNPVLGFLKGVGQTAKSLVEPPKYIEGVPDWQKPIYYFASKQAMPAQMLKGMVDEYALTRGQKADQANKETLLNYVRDISYNIPEFKDLPLDKRLNAYAQYLGYTDANDFVEKLTSQKTGKVAMRAANKGTGLPELQTPSSFTAGVTESNAKRGDLTFEVIQMFMPMPSSAAMAGIGIGEFASKLGSKLSQAAGMLGKGASVATKLGGKSLAELGGQKVKQGTEKALVDLEKNIPDANYPGFGLISKTGLGKTSEITTNKLSTIAETAKLKSIQEQAKKIGIDVEAIRGIREGEYWVAVSGSKNIGNEFLSWMSKVSKTNEGLNKLSEALKDKLYTTSNRGIMKSSDKFLPFKNIDDVKNFLDTGDTSLIAKKIELKGKPWTQAEFAKTQKMSAADEAVRAERLKSLQPEIDKLTKQIDELKPAKDEAWSKYYDAVGGRTYTKLESPEYKAYQKISDKIIGLEQKKAKLNNNFPYIENVPVKAPKTKAPTPRALQEATPYEPNIPQKPIVPKEPWMMTSKEWDSLGKIRAKREKELWNTMAKGVDPQSPHGRSLGQVIDQKLSDEGFNPNVGYGHKANVQQALSEGKPVPESVLKDYPDLVKTKPTIVSKGLDAAQIKKVGDKYQVTPSYNQASKGMKRQTFATEQEAIDFAKSTPTPEGIKTPEKQIKIPYDNEAYQGWLRESATPTEIKSRIQWLRKNADNWKVQAESPEWAKAKDTALGQVEGYEKQIRGLEKLLGKKPPTSKSTGIKVETSKTIPTEEIKTTVAKAATGQGNIPPSNVPPTVASSGDDYERLINALGKEKSPLKERIIETKNKFLREFYDRNRPLKELENETGVPVHKLAQVVPGSTAAGEDILRVSYRPVLAKVQKDIKFLEQYMVLKRNEDILVRNPKAKLPGGIANNANAMKALENKIGTERFKALEDASTELWKQNDEQVLKSLLKEGLISQESYDAIKSANPHYIPFQRADFVSDIEKSFVRPEANVSSVGLKKLSLEGSERALDNPLARLEAQVIRTQNIIFRNRAAKSIVTALQEAEKTTGNKLVKIVKEGGEHSNLVDTVSYFENGKKITAEVPAIYAQVAKGMEWEANNVLTKVLNKASAPLRYGAVTYNPAFLPVNLVRDAMTAFFREKLIPFSPDYFKGWTGVIRKNALYSDAARSGAFMSGIVDTMRTTDALKRVAMTGAITVKSPKDALLVLPRLVEKANLMGEQATRLATFAKLKAKGLDTLEAAVRTRDVTVDFAKAGTTMRLINQIVPFSNASVQGTANVLRVMKNNPKWAIVASTPFVTATILSRVNNMRWESSNLIPDYEYTNNWVIQIGEATNSKGETTPVYIKVPKGQIGSMLTFFPESLFNYNRQDNDKSVVENILSAGLEATKTASPISTDISGLMPPLLGTGVGVTTKVDPFTGRDIIPLGEQFNTPVTEQFGAETSSTAIALGQQFNVSPRLIDYAIKDYTAGTGELSMWLLDMGLGALGYNPQQEKEITDMPLEENLAKTPGVRRFLGTKNTRPYYLEKNQGTDTTIPSPTPVQLPKYETPKPKTTTTPSSPKLPNYYKPKTTTKSKPKFSLSR